MRHALALASFFSTSALAQTAPTEVLWYHGNGGEIHGSQFATRIASNGGSVDATTTWPTDLSVYRFVVLGRPAVEFTQQQVQDLRDYVDDQGVLVIAGEGNSAGQNHIVNTNRLLGPSDSTVTPPIHGLDLGMQLADTIVADPDNTCVPVTVSSDTPFLATTTQPSVETMGSIDVDATGTATPIAGRTFQVNMVTQAFTLMARNGLVLLVSDFSQFNDEACGLSTKQALWDNLYDLYCDRDDDTFVASACGGFDCDDLDDSVGATFTYVDADGDGSGSNTPSCEPDAVANNDDCDDTDPDVNPDQPEVCDGIDNDCNNRVDANDPDADGLISYWQDADRDGFGRGGTTPVTGCEAPVEGTWVENDGDCDDGDAMVNPDAADVCGNNLDDNCDGEVDETCVTVPPINTPAPTDDPEGCGCRTGSPGIGSVGLLGLLGLALRRRP
jgi:MYXO-CTERM domain-containing protein